MPEVLMALLCLATFCLGLIAIGGVIGFVIASASKNRPSPPPGGNDVQATVRTLRRLLDAGKFDAESGDRLFAALRREYPSEPSLRQPPRPAPRMYDEPPDTRAVEVVPPSEPVRPTPDVVFLEPIASEPALAAIVVEERSAVHPLDAPEPPAVAPVPSAPQRRRRALADVLQSFLQEKNIRWGELISGILIVGCSIALAVSLRREIESLSDRFIYLPALLFLAATAAIHGAGHYTLRRWKLRATSRGTLVIATLLIPINFLASILVTGPESRELPWTHPLYLSAVAIGAVSFGALSYFAGAALLRRGTWRLWLVVMGPSLGQLLVSRLDAPTSTPLIATAVLALPMLAFLAGTIAQLQFAARRPRLRPTTAYETLLVLGVALFSLAAPVALSLGGAASVREGVARLSLPLCAASVVLLATGLMFFRRSTSRQSAMRVVGLSLALLGGAMTFAGTAAAWPEPSLLIAVGLFGLASMTTLAIVGRAPALHVPAIACGSLAAVSAFHLFRGAFDDFEGSLGVRTVNLLLTGETGVLLTILAALVGIAAVIWSRLSWYETARSYLFACGGLAIVAVSIALVAGFLRGPEQGSDLATPVLLFVGLASLIAAYLRPDVRLASVGCALELVGTIHGLGWNETVQTWLASVSLLPPRPILAAALLYAVAASATAALLTALDAIRPSVGAGLRRRGLIVPLVASAALATLLALPSSLWVDDLRFGEHVWYVASAALVWLLIATARRSRTGFAVFQALATATVVLATTAVCQRQAWWRDELLDPRHLQTLFTVVAVWCLAWSVARISLRRRWPRLADRMRSRWIAVDEVALVAIMAAFAATATLICAPGVAIELGMASPTVFGGLDLWRTFFDAASWIALTCGFAAVLGWLIERRSTLAFATLLVVAAIAGLLVSGLFYDAIAVASAMRWSFAGLGIALTIAICFGDRISAAFRRIAPSPPDALDRHGDALAVGSTIVLSALPIVGLTTVNLIQAARGVGPQGPAVGTFFADIGSEASFGAPLAALVVLFVVHAVRERRPGLMAAGAVTYQYLVNLGYFLPILKNPGAVLGWETAIGCLQWNALGLAGFAVVWFALRRWIEHPARVRNRVEELFAGHLSLALFAAGATGISAAVAVFVSPHDLTPVAGLGSWPSFVVCLFGTAVGAWIYRSGLRGGGASLTLAFIFATAGPLAIAFEGTRGSWQAFHVLAIAWLAFATGTTASLWVLPRRRQYAGEKSALHWWATGSLAATAAIALRGEPFDPDSPWRAFAILASVVAVALALGIRARKQAYAYAAAATAFAAAAVAWYGAWPAGWLTGAVAFVHLGIIAIAATASAWLIAELVFRRRYGRDLDPAKFPPPMHLAAGALALSALTCFFGLGFALTGFDSSPRTDVNMSGPLGWAASLSLFGLSIGSLWDRRAILTLPSLYVASFVAAFMALDVADQRYRFDGPTMFVATCFVVATLVALFGHLWRSGAGLAAFGERVGIPGAVDRLWETSRWLPWVTSLLALAVTSASLVAVLSSHERWMRVAAACTPALLAYGVGCQAQRERREVFQYFSLCLACASAALVGWADLEPEWRQTLILERAVRLLIVFAALTFAFAIPVAAWVRRNGGDWLPVALRMGAACGVVAIATLVGVLALEATFFEPGVGVPFAHPYQFVAVLLALLGLIAAALTAALSPRIEFLSLSGDWKQVYVYVAEFVAAAAFAHVYMSYPQLFGALRDYWPYIVLAIAFAGVGAGELLRRAGVRVLAEPLQRTGGALPLLPAIGWWLNPALGIDSAGHYALLLFFAGVVYAALCVMRKSYVAGIAATLAGNAALWAALADYEPLALLKHPQTWLIPPALSTLVAAQILHKQLSAAQLTAIRYLCLVVVYASSTADVFIGGVGGNLWEPMILATLSTIGVLLGIALRIRAFLYLGATFVFMSVVSMVWHAYANIGHVGIWWGFGIALGVLILVFFGIFEKNRAALAGHVDALRSWDG